MHDCLSTCRDISNRKLTISTCVRQLSSHPDNHKDDHHLPTEAQFQFTAG